MKKKSLKGKRSRFNKIKNSFLDKIISYESWIDNRLKSLNPLIIYLIVFLVSFVLLFLLQFSTKEVIGTDGPFHIKYSSLIKDEGFISEFPWWSKSLYVEGYADEYIFFHYLMVPFTFFELFFAAKLFSVFIASVMAVLFFMICNKSGVRYSFFWLLMLFLASTKFTIRMHFPRAIILSVCLMLLMVYFMIFRRNNIALFLLSFLFVWSYPGFYLAYVVVGAYFLVSLIRDRKFDFKLILACIGGNIAGFIINPYFPQNVKIFLIHGFLMIYNILFDVIDNVPTELMKPELLELFSRSLIVFPLFILLGFYALVYCRKDKVLMTLFLIASIFLAGSFVAVRTIDYAVPFCVLFFAFAFSDVLKRKKMFLISMNKRRNLVLVMILFLVTFPIMAYNLDDILDRLEDSRKKDRFKDCAVWMKLNSEPGEVVFHGSWDNFPELFFYNSENYYLFGLTSEFMYGYDEKLYHQWKRIRDGGVKDPAFYIKRDFDARFVFVDNRYSKFKGNLIKDDYAELAYSNKDCTVFELI